MKQITGIIFLFFILLSLGGCETVYEGSKKGGEVIGKTTRTVGGVTEGAVDGYIGQETPEENPYGR